MSVLFSGLIHVTGDPDVGKSTFALECGALPEKIAFIDDDVKGKSTNRQLADHGHHFAIYHDLVAETKGMKELQFHEYAMSLVNEIINYDGELDAVIRDTWSRFEASFKPVISKNPNKFRDYWSPMGVIRGAEEWIEAQRYESEVLNRLLNKTKLVILTTHLKAYRVGGKDVPGKFVPRCQAPVVEKSLFRLWLRHNPSGRPVPIGLILKRLSDRRITEVGIRTVNILPRRIAPNENEHSLWDTILRYWNEPFGDRVPLRDETPDSYELSILEGTLTPDQKVALQLVLMEAQTDLMASEEVALSDKNTDIIADIQKYVSDHPVAKNDEIIQNIVGANVPLIIKAKRMQSNE